MAGLAGLVVLTDVHVQSPDQALAPPLDIFIFGGIIGFTNPQAFEESYLVVVVIFGFNIPASVFERRLATIVRIA